MSPICVPDLAEVALGHHQRNWLTCMVNHDRGLDLGLEAGAKLPASFVKFGFRIAARGAVIVERPLGTNGASRHVVITAQDWIVENEVEAIGLDGHGGVALGLPPRTASAAYREAIAQGEPANNPLAWRLTDRLAHNAHHPPRYRSLAGLGTNTLAVLETLIADRYPRGAKADQGLADLVSIATRLLHAPAPTARNDQGQRPSRHLAP